MEEKLSFIPRKSFEPTTYKSAGWGVAVTFCFLILLAVAIVGGGMEYYKKDLNVQIEIAGKKLGAEDAVLEPETINDIVKISNRIAVVKGLLSSHKTTLPIFDLLDELTLKDVRFLNFSFSVKDRIISLNGVAKSYLSLALQEEEFRHERNSDKIESVSLSNFALGEKGVVNFFAIITVRPEVLNYLKEKQ